MVEENKYSGHLHIFDSISGRDGRDGRDGSKGSKGDPGPPGLPGEKGTVLRAGKRRNGIVLSKYEPRIKKFLFEIGRFVGVRDQSVCFTH